MPKARECICLACRGWTGTLRNFERHYDDCHRHPKLKLQCPFKECTYIGTNWPTFQQHIGGVNGPKKHDDNNDETPQSKSKRQKFKRPKNLCKKYDPDAPLPIFPKKPDYSKAKWRYIDEDESLDEDGDAVQMDIDEEPQQQQLLPIRTNEEPGSSEVQEQGQTQNHFVTTNVGIETQKVDAQNAMVAKKDAETMTTEDEAEEYSLLIEEEEEVQTQNKCSNGTDEVPIKVTADVKPALETKHAETMTEEEEVITPVKMDLMDEMAEQLEQQKTLSESLQHQLTQALLAKEKLEQSNVKLNDALHDLLTKPDPIRKVKQRDGKVSKKSKTLEKNNAVQDIQLDVSERSVHSIGDDGLDHSFATPVQYSPYYSETEDESVHHHQEQTHGIKTINKLPSISQTPNVSRRPISERGQKEKVDDDSLASVLQPYHEFLQPAQMNDLLPNYDHQMFLPNPFAVPTQKISIEDQLLEYIRPHRHILQRKHSKKPLPLQIPTFGSHICNFNPFPQWRPILVDGANVARMYEDDKKTNGEEKKLNFALIADCVNSLAEHRGVGKTNIFVVFKWCQKKWVDQQLNICRYKEFANRILYVGPEYYRRKNEDESNDYDDAYLFEEGYRSFGLIISNDMFDDIYSSNPLNIFAFGVSSVLKPWEMKYCNCKPAENCKCSKQFTFSDIKGRFMGKGDEKWKLRLEDYSLHQSFSSLNSSSLERVAVQLWS